MKGEYGHNAYSFYFVNNLKENYQHFEIAAFIFIMNIDYRF